MWLTFLTTLLNIIDLVLPLLIAVAYFTLASAISEMKEKKKKKKHVEIHLGGVLQIGPEVNEQARL